jgi:hypothetical protein
MHEPRRTSPDHPQPPAPARRLGVDGPGRRSTDPAERLIELIADEFTLLETRIAALEVRLSALERRGIP